MLKIELNRTKLTRLGLGKYYFASKRSINLLLIEWFINLMSGKTSAEIDGANYVEAPRIEVLDMN